MNIDNFTLNIYLNEDKTYLMIETENKNSNINFKYEIYGNKNFFSSGVLKCTNCFIPILKFRILDDYIFFLKIKIFNKNISQSLFKFFNLNEYTPNENLSMSIEDINTKLLFESITLKNENEEDNNSEDNENSNMSNCENSSTCDSDNDIDIDNNN